MSHLYEELAKRKALVEQVNKLQSEVDQLDSTKAVPEKSISSTFTSTTVHLSMNSKAVAQTAKPVTTSWSTASSPVVSHVKPLASVSPSSSSPLTGLSKPSVVMSIPSPTLSTPLHYSTTQPQLVNTYQPLLTPVVGVPVQMVSYLEKDGKLLPPIHKMKQTKQKGNAKKKPRVSQQASKPVVNVTLTPSSAVLSPQSTAASPTTPTVSLWQSPSISRTQQPLLTSPVTPVSAPGRLGSALASPATLVTSPVTPTPVRRVSSNLSPVLPLSVASNVPQRSSSEVPPMVSFAQNGLSYISPLSPLSSIPAAARLATSCATPLSSLSASTEKYLNTFTTQSTVASKPSFSSVSQCPPVSNSQLSYSNRLPFLNTDLSTDHSAGIKLLCDLLNDTLPEQPPPLVATSLAVRSLGTPTSESTASSNADSSQVEHRRHADTPPAPSSKNASKSPRTSPMTSVATSQLSGAVSSSVEKNASIQKTSTNGGTPPAVKKRNSPFTIESLVSSSPESQSGKSKSPDQAEIGKREPSPASTSNRSSPKGKNKSPSTNFSIAHITRDMNTMSSTAKGNPPSITGPAMSSVSASVLSDEVSQQHRRTSPPMPRISNPESSDRTTLNAAQSSSVPVSGVAGEVDLQRQRVSAPVGRVCSPPTGKNSLVECSLVSNEFSRKNVLTQRISPVKTADTDRPINSPQEIQAQKSRDAELTRAPSSTKQAHPVSSEVSSTISSVNKISSSVSPEHGRNSSSTDDLTASIIPNIPLEMIPLPSGKRPSPEITRQTDAAGKKTNQTGSTGKKTSQTDFTGKKRRSPTPQIPKSTSPDSEVSSLMSNESLPQSPSISSSDSKAETALLEGQAPVLVDSNPCSARSPIPVAPSSILPPQSGVSLPPFGSVFSLTKGNDSTAKNSNQVSEKPSQSAKETPEPPAKKRKRKDKKKVPGKVKGALSLLIQYDSDSQSSCGTHTESDDSSGHSTSPVSGTLSPVVMEITDSPRHQKSGAVPEQSNETANNGKQMNGVGASSKSRQTVTRKKRPSIGKTPVEKKKARGGEGGKEQTNASTVPPFVNLDDTVVSMQQLKSVAPSVSTPTSYPPYPSGYPSYPAPGQHGYVMPGFPLPTSALNFTPGGHPRAQYSASLSQYYSGEPNAAPPGYSAPPRGYLPQWRTSYAPMQCQPPQFSYSNNGNDGSSVYR